MDWKYVLDKYIDKKDVECPVLDAFVKKKLEIKDYNCEGWEEEPYIKNWMYCNARTWMRRDGEDVKSTWRKVWRDQYWHLFVSWFAIAHGADFDGKPRFPINTELSIWLYESQGLFKGKEESMEEVIKTIEKLEGERSKWRKKIFEAGGIEKPSWKDIKARAHWE